MTELLKLPRRLTSAEQALVEAAESKGIVRWAVELARRTGLGLDRDEAASIAREALVLAARSYTPGKASFPTYAKKWVVGRIYDAARKELVARAATSALTLDAIIRQYGVMQSRERPEVTTPQDRPGESWARLQVRLARLAFELYLPTRLDALNPEERLVWSDEQHQVVTALRDARRGLAEIEDKVIERHYLEQASLEAIAAELGVSERSVKRLLRKARARLRRALEAHGITVSTELVAT